MAATGMIGHVRSALRAVDRFVADMWADVVSAWCWATGRTNYLLASVLVGSGMAVQWGWSLAQPDDDDPGRFDVGTALALLVAVVAVLVQLHAMGAGVRADRRAPYLGVLPRRPFMLEVYWDIRLILAVAVAVVLVTDGPVLAMSDVLKIGAAYVWLNDRPPGRNVVARAVDKLRERRLALSPT